MVNYLPYGRFGRYGRPLSILLMLTFCFCSSLNPPITHRSFVIILLIYLGLLMPALTFYELWMCVTEGFNYKRALVFNLFRIGPQYANFMWVYVMCHKEGHAIRGSLLKRGIMNDLFGSAFNMWVGMFFTISHIHNHHKYDNDENDVYSTAFRPRDQFSSWVKYVPEWMAYATNLSSFVFFLREGKYKVRLGDGRSEATTVYCIAL